MVSGRAPTSELAMTDCWLSSLHCISTVSSHAQFPFSRHMYPMTLPLSFRVPATSAPCPLGSTVHFPIVSAVAGITMLRNSASAALSFIESLTPAVRQLECYSIGTARENFRVAPACTALRCALCTRPLRNTASAQRCGRPGAGTLVILVRRAAATTDRADHAAVEQDRHRAGRRQRLSPRNRGKGSPER